MIEVSHLTKSYGPIEAVHDLSFSVKRGEIVGFLGENGAGKSTTMNMLTGCLAPTSGEIRIDGISMPDEPLKAKRHIGYLPEVPPLYPDLTVKEYLEYIFTAKKCRLNRKEHIAEICELTRIEGVFHQLIRSLSKGYRQRVGMAQALIGHPPLLILDEPTASLDVRQIVDIRRLITDVGRNRTVILSSHILPEVQMVCGRILLISGGKLVADDTTESLLQKGSSGYSYMLRTDAPAVQVEKLADREVYPYGDEQPDMHKYRIEDLEPEEAENLLHALVTAGYRVGELARITRTLEDVFLQVVEEEGGKPL